MGLDNLYGFFLRLNTCFSVERVITKVNWSKLAIYAVNAMSFEAVHPQHT